MIKNRPWRLLHCVTAVFVGTAVLGMNPACGGESDVQTSSCDAGDPNEARALTANDAWIQIATHQDPFWSESEEHKRCGDDALRVENVDETLWFDVTTEGCNYLTVSQPALGCADVGEDLTIWIFHYAITEGDGSYDMAVALGDPPEVVWEVEKPVPTIAGLVFEPVTLARPIEPGETITWHVSNHGSNTWSMIGIFAGAPGAVVPGSRAP